MKLLLFKELYFYLLFFYILFNLKKKLSFIKLKCYLIWLLYEIN